MSFNALLVTFCWLSGSSPIAHQGHPPQVVPPAGLWLGAVVPVVVSLIIFDWAPGVAVKIARRRYDRLHGYLIDPEYG